LPLAPHDLKAACEDTIIAIWYDIDYGDATKVQYFFTPDAALSFGERTIQGRPAIHVGYQERRNRGPRVSRHVISNVHVVRWDENSADVVSCVRLYAADGLPPQPNTVPLSVADTFDRFVRSESGWLIEKRQILNRFIQEGAVFAEPPGGANAR
jgi:hypothetical protein